MRLKNLVLGLVLAATSLSNPATASSLDQRVHKGFAGSLAAAGDNTLLNAFVQLDLSKADRVESLGLKVAARWETFEGARIVGPAKAFKALMREEFVRYIEPVPELRFFGTSEGWTVRSKIAQLGISGGPYRDGSGRILDGKGVGIAIVDSGVDGSHPDLKLGGSFVPSPVICIVRFTATGQCVYPGSDVMVAAPPLANTDFLSGHGTSVAGLAAGDGTASQGHFKGIAPGATLFGFRTALTPIHVNNDAILSSYAYIYANYDVLTPRIKVVNNSFGNGAGSAYDPNGLLEKAVKKLVIDKGVTFVFAAGNDGDPSQSNDQTSGYCKDPTPGVICAANYDDAGTGDRNGRLDDSSSRGRVGAPSTFPDLSAPGTFVPSTCAPTSGTLCNSVVFITPSLSWPGYYGTGTGTSLSAPIISGAVAMLAQANPALTPAQIENALLDTAHKFTFGRAYESDPQNSGSTTSSDKGAGLLDVKAALDFIGASADGLRPNGVVIADADAGDAVPGAVDIVSATVTRGAGGVTVAVTVRDITEMPPLVNPSLRITQNVGGRQRRTNITLTPAGAQPVPEVAEDEENAEASSASITGNTVTFFIPYNELGSPVADEPASEVFVSTFIGVAQDVAPDPGTSVGLDVLLRPVVSHYTVA